jgi:pilus assembly protein CpaC
MRLRLFAWLVALVSIDIFAAEVPANGEAQQTRAAAAAALQQAKEKTKDEVADNEFSFAQETRAVMHVGQVSVFETGPIDRVAVGDGNVVSTTVLDNRRLLVIAEDVGETNILLWSGARLVGNLKLRVTAINLHRQKREIALMLNDVPQIKIGNAGDKITIDGADLSPEQQARVKRVAEQYTNVIDRTRGVLQPRKPAPPSTMVMFDLYFLEFKKSFLQNIGVSWTQSFNGFNFGLFKEFVNGPLVLRPGETDSTFSNLPETAVDGTSRSFNVAMSLAAMINLAVNSGQATLLAAPKLAVRSGGTAKFLAGGEFPIAISGITGNTVQYKQYGIILEVEPTVSADNTVSGVIRAEVSALDSSVTINSYPGLLKRRTETDFHSKMGQAIVLSGLYSQQISDASSKVPLLGDIPLLKALFSNKGKNRSNTELVVFIVPHDHTSDTAMSKEVLSRASDLSTEKNTVFNGGNILPAPVMESELWNGMEKQFTQYRKPDSQQVENQANRQNCHLAEILAEPEEFEWTCKSAQP